TGVYSPPTLRHALVPPGGFLDEPTLECVARGAHGRDRDAPLPPRACPDARAAAPGRWRGPRGGAEAGRRGREGAQGSRSSADAPHVASVAGTEAKEVRAIRARRLSPPPHRLVLQAQPGLPRRRQRHTVPAGALLPGKRSGGV